MSDLEIKKDLLGRLTVHYECPHCSSRLTSPSDDAGTIDTCPDCDADFTVPGKDALDRRRRHERNEASRQGREEPRGIRIVRHLSRTSTADDGDAAARGEHERENSDKVTLVRQEKMRRERTTRLCWRLRAYAVVSVVLSCVLSIPLLIFGVFFAASSIAAVTASAGEADVELPAAMFGVTVVSNLRYVIAAVSMFMVLNIFALACSWGAQVLELLQNQKEDDRRPSETPIVDAAATVH